MRKYKLLATDIDGTLLNDDLKIGQENIDAIKKCAENGIHVALISGRPPQSIDMFLTQLGLKGDNIYSAGFHGGSIFSAKDMKVIHQFGLEKSLAMEILSVVEKIDNIGVLVYEGDTLYSHNLNFEVCEYCERTHYKVIKVDSYAEIKGDISKILVRGDDDKLMEVNEKCMHFNDRCKVMLTGYRLIEFATESGNKGDALEYICRLLNINIEESVSIGDNYNDVELITSAGVGVATANAVDALKELADYVTKRDNNKGAVAEIIEKYFFSNN